MTERARLEPRGRIPAGAVDALIGVGVAAVISIVISAGQGGRQQPDVVAYLWAAGLGALMLVRRRHPLIVLAVSALGLFAYYAAGYPAVGLAVPVAAALCSAAEFGHLIAAVATAATVTVVSVAFRLLEGQSFSLVVGYELVGHLAVMAGAIAFGDGLRARRELQAGARRLAELTAQQARLDAEAHLHAERLAIARDLHDSVGHDASVISLHAEVAREAVGRDDEAARRALELIRSAATAMLVELRRTVTLLRNPGERPRAVVSLEDLDELTRSATAAGFEVRTTVDPTLLPTAAGARALSSTTEAAVYRIVQEAITNVVRHSTGSRVVVTVARDGHEVVAEIRDDGTAGPPPADRSPDRSPEPAATGNGLRGMRERAEALGGRLTAGPAPDGFAVRAVLPLEGAA
ncbi:sensor histidine kinase [Agromyces sp. CFH 90414]|uniref:histidine kinase n=1 Tax=Agromyces agglutinans TaxID=2662258 RepID=A0A6I2F954_9MICO|nr:histidine kinase [Agromyces agglutinans]MRG60297.1 sensor histidine kinase [Agromyces agglutinans]